MLVPGPPAPLPGFWEAFGHSYFMTTVGTLYQTGRMDAVIRQALDIEHENWRNHCVTGAQLMVQGRAQGGYARIMQEVTKSTRTAPYAANGGGCFLVYGINDIGISGKTLQFQTAFGHALRASISRWRASSVKPDSDASIAYGAGFTQATGTQDFTSGTAVHKCTVTTSSTITITIPADYTGQTICVQFIGAAGVFGGSVSISGTASFASGAAISTSNITATSHCPVVRRFKGITSDAGKTLIFTATAVDASGEIDFNGYWIEADNPPPVVVANIARLTTAGYAGYATVPADTDVATFNTVISSVVAEFDGMVTIANIDGAINKDLSNPPGITTLYASDGVHPNEYGAAKCADAFIAAVRALSPAAGLGPSAQLLVDSPQSAAVHRPRLSQVYYLPEFAVWAGTSYTAVLGDFFAIPVIITEGRERWISFEVEQTNAPATSGSSIRLGIYDDVGWTGYPQDLVVEATSGGVLVLGTTSGMKTQAVNQPLDPGLYWIALKVDVLGTTASQLRAVQGPSPLLPATAWVAGTAPASCGWKLTLQAAGAMPGTFPTGAAVSGNGTGLTGIPCTGFKVN
jgi:hypothetical protein